jgi:NADPH:quinone reductase
MLRPLNTTKTLLPSQQLLRLSVLRQHLSNNPPAKVLIRNMASSIPKTMAAISIAKTGGHEVLEYKTDLPVPTPKEGQVLIHNEYVGVNFIDTKVPSPLSPNVFLTNFSSYFRSGLYKPPAFPYILGREGAGTVVSAPGTSFRVGDSVVYMAEAAYAEYTVAAAKSVAKIPSGISTQTAASALLQALTAWTLLQDAHPVKPGDYILVTAAAGGTGQWLVTMAKSIGAKVITTCSTGKIDTVKRLGADEVIDYSVPGGMQFSQKVIGLTPNKEGVAAVFDGVGKTTFDECLASVKRCGSMVSFGNASGAVEPFAIS